MPQSNDIERVIAEHGRSLGGRKVSTKELESRLDDLELLIEEMGQTAALSNNLNEYITDLRNDLKSLRRIRLGIIVLAILFVISADVSVFVLMFHHGMWFWLQDPYFKSAALVAVVTASVVLLSIMLKGAFHSLADRTKDDMIPPHLKETIDALKLMIGKQ